MKLIHHKLENGPFADPIEVEFTGHDAAPPNKYNDNAYVYLDKALGTKEKRADDFLPAQEHGNKVFLLTHSAEHPKHDDDEMSRTEIVVSSHPYKLLKTFMDWCNMNEHNAGIQFTLEVIHLQEFDSFESAYAVALAMREGHPLCYSE